MTLDGTLMSVTVRTSSYFEFEVPEPLFMTDQHFLPLFRTWTNQFAVSADGQRFLLNRRPGKALRGPITAMIPW